MDKIPEQRAMAEVELLNKLIETAGNHPDNQVWARLFLEMRAGAIKPFLPRGAGGFLGADDGEGLSDWWSQVIYDLRERMEKKRLRQGASQEMGG